MLNKWTVLYRSLVPTDCVRVVSNSVKGAEDYPVFAIKDLEEAIFSVKNEKAPAYYGTPCIFRSR